MSRWMKCFRRYRFFFLLFLINVVFVAAAPEVGRASLDITKGNFKQMLSLLPPIFILLGLLDVWVERETMMKYMGEEAGFKGAVLAFIMGSAAAGPLYAAFPVAAVLVKKGVKLTNIFIFIGAWSTTKIPMSLFEAANLGWDYMLLRMACNICGIIVIAVILEKTATEKERQEISLLDQREH